MSYGENDYIHIADWMWAKDGLGLKIGSVELALFARVHGFSRQGAGEFFELQQNTANLFEVSREAINRSMKALVEKGCVVELGTRRLANGRTAKVYSTQTEKVAKAMASYSSKPRRDLSSHPPSATCDEKAPEQPLRDRLSQPQRGSFERLGNMLPNCDNDALQEDLRPNGAPCAKTSHVIEGRTESLSEEDSSPSSRTTNLQVDGTLTETDEACFAALCRKSLKPVWVTTEDDARVAYVRALSKGYTSEQIAKAYDRYIRRYRNDNPDTPRFAKRLDAWLSDPNGLAWDAPKPQATAKRQNASPSVGIDLQERLAVIDPTYAELRMAHVRAVRDLGQAYGRHLPDAEIARLSEEVNTRLQAVESYFASHKQAVM